VPDFHIYEPLEMPPVEVEVDDTWWPGEARMRTRHDDGRITYQVQYRHDGATALDVFPAARVRVDENDRSRGRTP
jgi:hypothetical protein